MQKNVLHRYIKVKKVIEGQDFIYTWKIKDINVLTSIEIKTDWYPTTYLKPFALNLSQIFVTFFVFRISVGSEALE